MQCPQGQEKNFEYSLLGQGFTSFFFFLVTIQLAYIYHDPLLDNSYYEELINLPAMSYVQDSDTHPLNTNQISR